MRGWSLLLLPVLTAIALFAPKQAVALDSDLKGFAAFRLEASNGYTILGFAASERADGRGDIGLIVHRNGASVLYGAPATVTPTELEADLGKLGRISLDIAPSGVERTLRSRCSEPVTFEPDVYRGTFEFHGEEGYTEAKAATLREYARFGLELGCWVSDHGEENGAGLPGARFTVRAGSGHHQISLQINKNRPGARVVFEAEAKEKRDRIEITRVVSGRVASDAFDYDPLLRTATVDPPAPFSGQGIFRRNAAAPNRWSGNLTVDFPGRSNLPLVVAGVRSALVPACRHQGSGHGRC